MKQHLLLSLPLFAALTSAPLQAALTYLDASTLNTTSNDPARAANWSKDGFGTATQWGDRDNGNAINGSFFEGYDGAPLLVTSETGLTAGTYDVYVEFLSYGSDNWGLGAGFSAGDVTIYDGNNAVSLGNDRQRAYMGSTVVGVDGILEVFIDAPAGSALGPSGDPLEQGRGNYDGFSYELVPEPSSAGLLALGMAGVILRRRRA